MSRLEAADVSVSLGGRPVLQGASLAAEAGDLVGLIGPNGAGKTTLLRVLAGLLTPDTGQVQLGGAALHTIDLRQRARRISYLPQDGQIFWRLPVEDLVLTGRLPYRRPFSPAAPADMAAAARAMASTGIEDLRHRVATELSGGERARVLLARALAGEPEVLLADEPVAGLDPYHRLEVMDHFTGLAQAGTTVIVVLHDLTLAARYCNRVVLMAEGGIVADGAPEAVLTAPRLEEVYHIRAVTGEADGRRYLVPWSRL